MTKPLRKPITGEAAMEIRVWYESAGESPGIPYRVERKMHRRYIRVPGEHLCDEPEAMDITTDHGDTTDPFPEQ